jgi:hypothetical protein
LELASRFSSQVRNNSITKNTTRIDLLWGIADRRNPVLPGFGVEKYSIADLAGD